MSHIFQQILGRRNFMNGHQAYEKMFNSMSLVIKKMQTKITMRYHYASVIMATFQWTNHTKMWQ